MPPQEADQHGDSLESLCADLAARRHVIVASNRGPVSFETGNGREDGVVLTGSFRPGPLGVVADALPLTWVSIVGSRGDRAAYDQADGGRIASGIPDGWSARLVSPSRRALHRYYNVICNPLLWFLHHRSWGFTHTPNIDREAHTAWQQGFLQVSEVIADAIRDEATEAGRPVAVMLRDYHMHAVGGMVRARIPDAVIHYSPRIPWPGPADWVMLPTSWRDTIFGSLLECDVVEVTSERDARSLLACLEEFGQSVVDVDRGSRQVHTASGRVLTVVVQGPVLDRDGLFDVSDSRRTETFIDRISQDSRHTVVMTDRVEPHRNIVRCIRAFGHLLARDKSLSEEIRLLLVLAPPPPHLTQYSRYLSEIQAAVRDVNGKHRASSERPIELRVENNYPMALAAVAIADQLVSIPLADAEGTTVLSALLVNENDCSLLLSETASVAELLTEAANVVSPTDVESIADSMLEAFNEPDESRAEKFERAEELARARTADQLVHGQLSQVLRSVDGR